MQAQIRSRLEEIGVECRALEEELAKSAVGTSRSGIELSQKYSRLKKISDSYVDFIKLEHEITETEAWLKEGHDEELVGLIREELAEKQQRLETMSQEITRSLVPEDPRDLRNAIIEVRGGAGGEESALFAADLMRMYQRYAENKGFRVELLEAHPTQMGGFKTLAFSVSGRGAFGKFKFESGVHRVQRVPETEAAGRIHTSTTTVAVLKEVEEVDIKLRDEDLEIDAFRSSGPGGQNVNKVSSAIRIKHIPTGIVVACQEERSQHKNKERALKLLRARIQEQEEIKVEKEREHARRIQIGTAARSEKIRTYNFPQNRVTDHRIELTLYRLDSVMEGNLDLVIDPLIEAYNEDRLAELVKV
ncbi:peptide chain release factor 1 [Candidatus Acetothermia bacterium]|nr:peptide chain release factor 1 [Candidatus Acetothermia bacterium]MBI3643915.1 peptide chain release factor 1 [Candidatus Acetothermia bacterium]